MSVDAFRTWRDAIPALAVHKGHAPTFTPGDVIALGIIAELVRDYGVRVSVLAERLERLLIDCHGRSWHSLEGCVILIEAETLRLADAEASRKAGNRATTIVIPCAPIVARLQGLLIATEAEQPQGHLQFPPTAVSS